MMNTKKEMKPKISKRKEKELKTYNKKLSVFLAIFLVLLPAFTVTILSKFKSLP